VCDAGFDKTGKVKAATQLHHIEKITDAPHRRMDVMNTIAVCEDHHRQIEGMTPTELEAYLKDLESEQ